MWETFFDVWSIIHVVMFFTLGLLLFSYCRKAYIAVSIGMLVAVAWEVFERFYLAVYVGHPVFFQSYVNSFSDVFVFDIIGLALAYIYIKLILKRQV